MKCNNLIFGNYSFCGDEVVSDILRQHFPTLRLRKLNTGGEMIKPRVTI